MRRHELSDEEWAIVQIERFFNRLKHFRGLATRYDRCPENFLAAIKLAATRIWLATYESTT